MVQTFYTAFLPLQKAVYTFGSFSEGPVGQIPSRWNFGILGLSPWAKDVRDRGLAHWLKGPEVLALRLMDSFRGLRVRVWGSIGTSGVYKVLWARLD